MRYKASYLLAATSILAFGGTAPAAAQDYYIGQVIEVGNNYCPRGFALANGQLLSIQQNAALFSLLGTTYGGNGVTVFQLPDLRGRMAIGDGQGPGLQNYTQGQVGGSENVTHTISNLPQHSHVSLMQTVTGNAGEVRSFRNSFAVTADNQYAGPSAGSFDGSLNSATLSVQQAGAATSSVQLPNMAPFTVTQYCIALQGIFPSRN